MMRILQLKLIFFHLEKQPDAAKEFDEDGHTPLREACIRYKTLLEVVSVLLRI